MSERRIVAEVPGTTRREQIAALLDGSLRITSQESTWEYHGVRAVNALTLALLEIADALVDIAAIEGASDAE